MEEADIKPLIDAKDRLLSAVPTGIQRYLAKDIDWHDRLICIKGPKGTGKTTLILQHIRERFGLGSSEAIYFSADHIWFASHDIMDAVDYFHSHGYTHLFIDEVHHLENWSRVIKTVCDSYPKLNVVYSGSSILKLSMGSADLSRRQAVYSLKGLSFREFLRFEGVLDAEPIALETLLRDHRKIALGICDRLKVLPLFERYVKEGYYPIYKDVSSQFADRLVEIVNSVLEVDFPTVEDVTLPTVRKTKKMLMVLAGSCPLWLFGFLY